MGRLRPPKWKAKKGGVLAPYVPYPGKIEVLRDIIKALQYYSGIYAAGGMDYKSFRGEQHALNAMRQALATSTMIELKHGAVENQARKPIMVVVERRIERPQSGVPPRRPEVIAKDNARQAVAPNGGPTSAAPRPPHVPLKRSVH